MSLNHPTHPVAVVLVGVEQQDTGRAITMTKATLDKSLEIADTTRQGSPFTDR